MTNKHFAASLGSFAGAMLLMSHIAAAQQVTIAKDSTLHASPSTDAAAVTQLKQGATGEVIGRGQGAWLNVKTAAGTGWMYSFNVTYPAGPGPAPAAGTRRAAPVTATAGIRGLEKEEMKNAQFDGKQLDALDSFAGDGGAGEKPRGKK